MASAKEALLQEASAAAPLEADAYRLAFADPEFMLRRETRGLRIQLEMLKPELEQHRQGIENTIVVFGSARFAAPEQATAALTAAESNRQTIDSSDPLAVQAAENALRIAQRQMRNAHFYTQGRCCTSISRATQGSQ